MQEDTKQYLDAMEKRIISAVDRRVADIIGVVSGTTRSKVRIKYTGSDERIKVFINQRFVICEDGVVAVRHFKKYFQAMGGRASQKMIADYMRRRGFGINRRYLDGQQLRIFTGLKIKED